MKPTFTITQDQVAIAAARPVRVQHYRCPEAQDIGPHDHEYYEITVVRAGTSLHRTPFTETRIGPGSAIILAPGGVHEFIAPHALEVTNVYYLAEWLMDDLASLWRQPGFVPLFLAHTLFEDPATRHVPMGSLDATTMEACMHELEDIVCESQRNEPSLIVLRSALLKFLVTLSRSFEEEAPSRARSFRKEVWLALDRVEQCIAQSEPFRVAELAREVGISTDHLTRMFRHATGRSPMEYYQRRRVQKAGRLLLEADREITEIAHTLGYCDAAHFCKVFRRIQGRSPRDYRATYGLHR